MYSRTKQIRTMNAGLEDIFNRLAAGEPIATGTIVIEHVVRFDNKTLLGFAGGMIGSAFIASFLLSRRNQ